MEMTGNQVTSSNIFVDTNLAEANMEDQQYVYPSPEQEQKTSYNAGILSQQATDCYDTGNMNQQDTAQVEQDPILAGLDHNTGSLSQQANGLSQCFQDAIQVELGHNAGNMNQQAAPLGQGLRSQDPTEVKEADENRKRECSSLSEYQLQKLESFFQERTTPTKVEKNRLAKELVLSYEQIHAWFHKRRNKKGAMENFDCPKCGARGPKLVRRLKELKDLKAENHSLRQQVEWLTNTRMSNMNKGMPKMTDPSALLTDTGNYPDLDFRDLILLQGEKCDLPRRPASCLVNQSDQVSMKMLAMSSMDELIAMARIQAPLWTPVGNGAMLDNEEYMKAFPNVRPRYAAISYEATWATGHVQMDANTLVWNMMDAVRWWNMFPTIVARAMMVEDIYTGLDGVMQLMKAELQVPTPLVHPRLIHFLRYCRQLRQGLWAVVDFSFSTEDPSFLNPAAWCLRRPSGCIIQEEPNGHSQVTWVEHVDVNNGLTNPAYKPFIFSGLGFGAKRWINTLHRHCERIASSPPLDVAGNVLGNEEGLRRILRLEQRMVISFCHAVSSSPTTDWKLIAGSGDGDIKLMTFVNRNDPGYPIGILLSATTSFWLPASPMTVFDFIVDNQTRSQLPLWNDLSGYEEVEEIATIGNDREPGNSISLQLIRPANPEAYNGDVGIVQETWSDPTCRLIIYNHVLGSVMNNLMYGEEDPERIKLTLSGFSILPDREDQTGIAGSHATGSGSLVTISHQIIAHEDYHEKVQYADGLVKETMEKLKAVFDVNENPPSTSLMKLA